MRVNVIANKNKTIANKNNIGLVYLKITVQKN